MHVGLDIGYFATKYVSGARQGIFPSAVGSPDRARFGLDASASPALILAAPTRVAVGAAAIRQSRLLQRREDRRWTASADWYALFLAALTELSRASRVEVDLVLGLPVAFYDDRAALQERVRGEHRVQREGRRAQMFRVRNVRIIPQPFGTLLAETLSASGQIVERRLAAGQVGVIGIGGKTSNLLSANRLTEISRATASVNVGGWTLVRAVRDWLSREYPGLDDLRDHQIADAIQARKIRFYGAPVADFPTVVADLAAALARQINAEAGQLWNGGATLDAILVTGGGALLLGEHICRHWPHARLVSEPLFANARGYWKLARRLFAGGKQEKK